MKKVLYRQSRDVENKIKNISVLTKNEDKESRTEVFKRFVYKIFVVEKKGNYVPPQVFIRKSLDTNKNIEKFNFRVKGSFYITHDRKLVKVSFIHTLNILIFWKKKVFSPKKSEVLTK